MGDWVMVNWIDSIKGSGTTDIWAEPEELWNELGKPWPIFTSIGMVMCVTEDGLTLTMTEPITTYCFDSAIVRIPWDAIRGTRTLSVVPEREE